MWNEQQQKKSWKYENNNTKNFYRNSSKENSICLSPYQYWSIYMSLVYDWTHFICAPFRILYDFLSFLNSSLFISTFPYFFEVVLLVSVWKDITFAPCREKKK